METVLLLLLIANLAGLFLIWQRQDKQDKYLAKNLEDQADNLSDQLDYRFEQARQANKQAPVNKRDFSCFIFMICPVKIQYDRLLLPKDVPVHGLIKFHLLQIQVRYEYFHRL